MACSIQSLDTLYDFQLNARYRSLVIGMQNVFTHTADRESKQRGNIQWFLHFDCIAIKVKKASNTTYLVCIKAGLYYIEIRSMNDNIRNTS